jgi:hypothetical protein
VQAKHNATPDQIKSTLVDRKIAVLGFSAASQQLPKALLGWKAAIRFSALKKAKRRNF